MFFSVNLSSGHAVHRRLKFIIYLLVYWGLSHTFMPIAQAQDASTLPISSKSGFHFGPEVGYGQLSAKGFEKDPPTLEAGFHLGYDWQIFSVLGVGLGSSVVYNYQIANGKDIGGTYSGPRLNPVQPRLSIYLGSVVLSYEHYLFSNFSVTRKTADGEKLEWLDNTGFEVALALPFQMLGGYFTIYYSQNEYGSEKQGGSKTDLNEAVRFSAVGFRLTYRPFSSSIDMNYY